MRRHARRPVIGVTVSRASGWRIFPLIWLQLWFAGARGVKWQRGEQIDIDRVDGIIIGGGDDIFPGLYGTEIVTRVTLDPARDRMEKDLTEQALARDLPILGICRGAQMLNVVLGGTLWQDAYEVYGSRRYRTILPRRRITVHADSRLADIAGQAPMRVNSLHSQAVQNLGEGLRIAATDEAGMIQAIERISDPFALGVQWHPEHIPYARRQRRIFRALVEAAAARSRGGEQTVAVEGLMRSEKYF